MAVLAAAASTVAALVASGPLPAQVAPASLAAAKHRILDASYRNDREVLSSVVADLGQLARTEPFAAAAWYHEGFARWLLAASHLAAGDTAAAKGVLTPAYHALKRASILQPDDADVHAMLAWVIMTIAVTEPTRWALLAPEASLHRRRAVELGPRNPRVAMMDAGMLFYTPAEAGGGHDRALARGREALAFDGATEADRRMAAEGESLAADWGGAMLYGWLANLCLQTEPPRREEALALARRALEMRPDYWWVRTHVLPLALR